MTAIELYDPAAARAWDRQADRGRARTLDPIRRAETDARAVHARHERRCLIASRHRRLEAAADQRLARQARGTGAP